MKNSMKKIRPFALIKYIVVCICLFGYIYCTIKWAWCSDDAYHAYSMSKNAINGNGFTPTVGKRVNVSTCPLWTLMVTLGMLFYKDEYYVGMILNLLLSWGAYIGLLYAIFLKNRMPIKKLEDILGMINELNLSKIVMLICLTSLICSSKSFISYTTSGLENALLFFLSTIFIIRFMDIYKTKYYFNNHSIFILAFIEGLIIFTRMDAVLIFAPVCIFAGLCIRPSNLEDCLRNYLIRLGIALLGIFPFIIWEIFSFIYYGMLVPNTALAKLNTGFPQYQYTERGFAYYIKTLNWDIAVVAMPILFIMTSIIVFGIKKNKRVWRIYLLFAIGIASYMIYIIYIGGDFMMGRHFTDVFWSSLLLFTYMADQEKCYINKISNWLIKLLYFLIFISIMLIETNIWENPLEETANNIVWVYTDERKVYIPYTGLINIMINGKSLIKECPHRGIQWYFGADWYEERLYDPLLSRLPAEENNNQWIVGHMERKFPQGYQETLNSGENQIVDENLHAYYDVLYEVISGDVFSYERFKKIVFLNLGKYDYLLEKYYEYNN